MRCAKCGRKIKPDSSFCTHCGNKIEVNEQCKDVVQDTQFIFDKIRPYKKQLIIIICILFFVTFFFRFRCKAGLCLIPSGLYGEYCAVHTCEHGDCVNKKAKDEIYCYIHLPSPTTYNGTYSSEVAERVLTFSNIDIEHNSVYTVCTGKLTNNGEKTYSFVEVKGAFKNSSGTVIDTDWTYAVGSEGLAAGESTTFRLSVDKNYSITSCTMTILDYER